MGKLPDFFPLYIQKVFWCSLLKKKAMLLFKSGFPFGFDKGWWEGIRSKGESETFIPIAHK